VSKLSIGVKRVWLLTGGVAAAAGLLTLAIRNLPTLSPTQFQVDWWALAIMMYLAEITVVHLRFNRHAYSFSMSEIPMVVALFMVGPVVFIFAQLLATGTALLVNRRQPWLKLTFNLAHLTFESVVAVIVFRSIAAFGDPLGVFGWLAALVAVQISVVIANILINAAIQMSGANLERTERLEVFGITALAAAMNTSLALVGVTILWTAPETAWLALVPPMVLFLAYRAYVGQRVEKSRLESLYEATRVLHSSPQIEAALSAAAKFAQNMFEAEVVEITLLPDDENQPAYRTSIGPDEKHSTMQPVSLGGELEALREITVGGEATFVHDAASKFAGRATEMTDVMAAPLTRNGQVFGVLLLANRLGDVSEFDRSDVRLLETFASQVSVSLENGRLEDSLLQLTELKDQLRHQALHDSLTQLANRTLFTERVEAAIDTEPNELVAVLFLDLDDFKTVNDSLGHAAGDTLLTQVANRLRTLTRPHDIVARLGGDEFAVLVGELGDPRQATDVAQRIIDGLIPPFSIEGRDLTVRSSIGVAYGTGRGIEADQLLRNADAAMYAAKQSTKGTFRVFEDEMHAELIRRLELKADLRAAIDQGDLHVKYQPIVDLFTGEISGVEALVRWDHPTRGEVPPSMFIAFAEETGQIEAIGRLVMDRAIADIGHLHRLFPDRRLSMAVNLSPRELGDPDFAREIAARLNRHGVERDLLVLEITENIVMQTAIGTLDDLRILGVRIAIDDFGTGYSSLAYLDRLPIDLIKIDKSFVDRLAEETPLVRTVLQLGQAIGMDSVIEGIETPDQLDRLRELGCSYGQGYFLSRPLDLQQLEALLRESKPLVVPVPVDGDRAKHSHLRIIS